MKPCPKPEQVPNCMYHIVFHGKPCCIADVQGLQTCPLKWNAIRDSRPDPMDLAKDQRELDDHREEEQSDIDRENHQ